MTTDPKVRAVAALIVNSLKEQGEGLFDGGFVRTSRHDDGTDDLTDVTIDGHYDLEALAAAIIYEVRE